MSSGRHRRADDEPVEPVAPVPPVGAAAGRTVSAGIPMSAPATPGPTVVVRRARSAARLERRRAARRRVLVLVAAGLAVLLAGVAIWAFLRGDDATDDPAATRPAAVQLTTLVQVTGADGNAVASALVGTTARNRSAVSVLVPSRLIVDVAGAGELSFGEAAALDTPDASAGALTDLLGVTVQASWALTTPALAALVDAVGGVQVDVDTDVVATDTAGTETVLVRAGTQSLGGAAAAAYATYLGSDEPEQARLARFDAVFAAVAARLPTGDAGLVSLLAGLGDGSRSTLDSTALAQRLRVLRAATAGGDLVSDILPVTELDGGGPVTPYGVDAEGAATMLTARFSAALLRDSDGKALRVLVENGVGTPGLVEQARAQLVDAGLVFINGGNASPFNDDPSVVLVPDGTEESMERGTRVAEALGLTGASVVPDERQQSLADAIVILGPDYEPPRPEPTS